VQGAFEKHQGNGAGTYVEPVTDTIESVYDAMTPDAPVMFLFSRGADPPRALNSLQKVEAAGTSSHFSWLQNCELGLGLMNEMESIVNKLKDSMDPNFRLFMTALPHPEFPLGLLQMCTKLFP